MIFSLLVCLLPIASAMGQMAQGPSVHETDDDAEFVMSKMLRPSLERSSEALARDMTQLYYSSGHSSNHHVSARSLDKKGEEVSTLKAYIDSHFSEPALKSFKGPLKALLNSGFSEYSIAKESLIGNAVVKRSPMTDDAVNEDELKLAKTHAKMISSSIRVQFSHHLKVKLHEWADSEKKAIKEIKNQHKKLKEKKWLRKRADESSPSISRDSKQSDISMALEKLPETTATQETEKLLGSDWKKDLKEILLTPTHPERKSLIKETMVSSSVFHILMFSLPLIGLIFLPIVNGMGGLFAAGLFVSWGLSPILHRLLFNSWF